ncbi:GldG family protein [Gammaproteobacteria bacterium]|uniref:ABC transporter n=1 Tax=OM182 bacterium MED-G28 TaxID=1986256 RepID=A0A2A5WE61_9GAMM|nr:GldG family protein [Gammaproteobacteria bacterium]PDH34613.1 MAG: ABC transporter [OM182 bacterium MED-G28]
MNSKSLFSSFGLVAIAVGLLFSVLFISLLPSLRVDLTEDNLYSLSEGTRSIVSSLEEPIEIMFFYSDSATEDIPQIRSYGTRVQELLREIVIASNGNLRLNMIDPEPFSEEEDLATQYGIRAVPVTQGGEGVYFGLVVTQDSASEVPLLMQASETMQLIRPDQEEFLEYEFMKLITKVANPDRTVIGLLTQLDIDGGFDPVSGQGTQQWMIMDLIRQLYEVRRVDITGDSIDGEIDILMIVHPQGLSDQILYAIDQHVMRGGNTMLFLDPNADSMVSRSVQGNLIPAGMSSELPGLLAAWGIDFDNSKVLADNEQALRVMMGQGQRPVPHLGMLGVQRNFLTQDDIITNRLETINMSSAGAISQAEGAGTTFEPLIVSSSDAMLMERTFVESVTDPSVLFDEFESANQSFVIAARVSGIVESAFPEGRPELIEEPTEEVSEAESTDPGGSAGNPADTDATMDDAEEEIERAVEHIASSNGSVNIVAYADSDVLTDRLWVQVSQFLGQRIPQPFANNGDIVINTLDNLSGDADLSGIRSRGRYSRPFIRVLDLQRQADDRLREEEAELLERLAESEAALAQLNQDEDGNPIGQLTPEIQTEIDRFNEEMLETRRRLRDVRFQLTEDIEQLGTNLKAANTALIPILLTIFILIANFLRVQRRKVTR